MPVDPSTPHHPEPTGRAAPDHADLAEPAPGLAPTLRRRLAVWWFRLVDRLHVGVISAHLAVGSLIGVEGLAVVLGFSSAWPIAIPFVLLTLTLVAFTRGRARTWFRRRRP